MRKPKIEYYWSLMAHNGYEYFVNWRLVGANGEIMCSSSQGFRDKTDAQRSINDIGALFYGEDFMGHDLKEVGPGRKPK